MARLIRAGGIFVFLMMGITMTAYVGIGGWYMPMGNEDTYPITVRMWLNDSFIGGVYPSATPVPGSLDPVGLIAGGNDLIFVPPDSPRCPVYSIAWVTPVNRNDSNPRMYNATITCDYESHGYGSGALEKIARMDENLNP